MTSELSILFRMADLTMQRQDILVLATGGTISARPTGAGVSPSDGLALSTRGCTVEVLLGVPSGAVGLPEISILSERIRLAEEQGITAVVVTHGTDTLGETAFALSLLKWRKDTRIILTGAMRSPSQSGSDGQRNLDDAVDVAASSVDFGSPVLVVFDGLVFAGRTVEKCSATSTSAFGDALSGPLGRVIESRVVRHSTCVQSDLPLSLDPSKQGRVIACVALPGQDGSWLDTATTCGVDGVVVAGLGGGHVPPQMIPTIARVCARIPVVVTTGVPFGGSLVRTYDGAGSELDLARRGAVIGWSLGPRKASLALSMVLGQTADLEIVKEFLTRDMGGLSGVER